mmetsp:Transcript_20841/g.32154  ORF Transcript_20841/g.32154 Transcript_20841/m.32154 type:complete len:105 (+) Transcript_20841:2165-2479(+)
MAHDIVKTPTIKPRDIRRKGQTTIQKPVTHRYKSQMRGGGNDTSMKTARKANVGESSMEVKARNHSRDASHISRASGTNVSYTSSFSAIKTNIMRFKNKDAKIA